jgi:putative molybdopterin biosynthesis protein
MKNKRNIYLETVDLEEAIGLCEEHFENFLLDNTEMISVDDSLGRKLAKPIFAQISNPHYNASAMDGIAVEAKKTYGAHERNTVKLKVEDDFVYVDTGDPIVYPYNSVIMIEDVNVVDAEYIEIMKPSHPWQHVRVVGEDIAVGDMILPSGHEVKPVDLGAILSGGLTEIEVQKKSTVGIIPTGTEIVNPGDTLKLGSIIDSNSRVFEAMVIEAGGIAKRYKPVKDDRILIKQAIEKAVEENDIVVINAGSSAGSEDYTCDIINEIGEVFVHGIAIKPGKPTILGKINGKPVIGIPGYPVSAFISFREFVIPLISNHKRANIETTEIVLSKRIVSALKHKEFVRMKLGKVGDNIIGTPLSRGAGVTMSLVKADGILTIPKNVEGYEAGRRAEVELLRNEDYIKNSLVSIGSHDIIIDHLNDIISKESNLYSLSSAHVGSLGGIMAIKKGEAHIAPIHLLDEVSGEYNTKFVEKYLKNKDVYLIKGIKRVQGIYVKKGNPLNIKSIEDIVDKKLIFANRQKGSGTRVLFDYYLKKQDMDNGEIEGYKREFTTHTGVALAVKSGNADIGLGIESVAKLMDIDFIPMALEDYDFLVSKDEIDHPIVKNVLEILKSKEFKCRIENLGGYELHPLSYIEFKAKEEI